MRKLFWVLTIIFCASLVMAQESYQNKDKKTYTSRALHKKQNITITNPDGSISFIRINGGTSTIRNEDGTQLILQYGSLTNPDGTLSRVTRSGKLSTILNGDGTVSIINHKATTSSSSSEDGIHVLMHNFGFKCEKNRRKIVDILAHRNWHYQLKIKKHLDDLEAMNMDN